jgi:hypothetical protein
MKVLIVGGYGTFGARLVRLTFGLAMAIEDGRLRLIVRQWSVVGVPCPASSRPLETRSKARKTGAFTFMSRSGSRGPG